MNEPRQYTPGEQFANVSTHLIAALISLYGIIILIENSENAIQAVSTTIFGGSLFILFISSVFYHWARDEKIKLFAQKIDHSAIYLLIAGTYTPALMLTLKFPLSAVMVVMIWLLALMGILFSCVKLKGKKLSTILYLIMGWLSVFFIYNVWMASHLTVWLMLVGGLFYSLGCAFYLNKSRYTHFVWHLFVIAGAMMHFFAILELLKAVN